MLVSRRSEDQAKPLTVWSIEDTEGKEPSSWKFSRFANIGAGEPFVHQIMQELPQLVEAGSITEASLRTRVKEAILLIGVEGLMPALNSLNKIRSLPEEFTEMDRSAVFASPRPFLLHRGRFCHTTASSR